MTFWWDTNDDLTQEDIVSLNRPNYGRRNGGKRATTYQDWVCFQNGTIQSLQNGFF